MNCAFCLNHDDNEKHEAVALISSTIYCDHDDEDDVEGYEIFYPVCQEIVKQIIIDNRTVIMIPGHNVELTLEANRAEAQNALTRLSQKTHELAKMPL